VTVTPADAMGQVGHSAKVCGMVASAVYEAGTRGHPTFVTLMSPDQPGANRTLTAVIYGTDLAKFGGTPRRGNAGAARLCDRVRQLLPPEAGDDPERPDAGELSRPQSIASGSMRGFA